MSQLGRISGPLLKANLLRQGVDLAFETDLLYLDVNNSKIGIKTSSPTHDLTVNGTTKTTDLIVTNQLEIGNLSIVGNTISTPLSTLNLLPSGNDPVVYQAKLTAASIDIYDNVIATNTSNANLELRPQGTGTVEIFGSTNVYGDIHATGNITADGDVDIGDANTDNIIINAEVASDIIPDQDNQYKLGEFGKRWSDVWVGTLTAATISTNEIVVNGIDLGQTQGNVYYVAKNGLDTNAGQHQNNPFLTVKKALQEASAGDTIFIYPGIYNEIFPLTVPVGVTVRGAGLRSVMIAPTVATKNNDAFLLNGETTIEDLTIADFFSPGYAFKFVSNLTVTTRSPYIRNVSVLTKGSVVSESDPLGFDAGDAGRGAYIDGGIVNAASKEASMLFHSATFITPGVDCITATNGVRIEWLNSFTYYANKGMNAISGSTGFAGQGKTTLRFDNIAGIPAIGETVSYYDTDGVTVLASGQIFDIVNGKYILNGKVANFALPPTAPGKVITAFGNAKLSNVHKKFGATSLALDGTGDYVTVASNADFAFGRSSRPAKSITVAGDAAISAAQSKFGEKSILFDGTGDKVTVASSSDFAFGTGDFTAEAWIYRNSTTGAHCIFDFRSASAGNNGILLFTNNTLQYSVGGSVRISVGVSGTGGTWTHIALVRSAGTSTLYANGAAVGTPYVDSFNYIASTVTVGAYYNNVSYFNGYIDEVRVSNSARYTGTFTVPSAAFTHDANSRLLIHADTAIVDDSGVVGDFTLEGFLYRTAGAVYQIPVDMRIAATDVSVTIGIDPSNYLYVYINGAIVIQGATTVPANAWAHVALSRENESLRLFLNGVQQGSTYVDLNNYTARPLRIGTDYNAAFGYTGYVDEFRISKGVSRYNAGFTAPTIGLVRDTNTVFLTRFDGDNNSTTIVEDLPISQDIRFSGGGTANYISLLDYSDFGAEIRGIGSANVYGNYGAYADGLGNTMYLVSHNFAYIGTGKDSSNDVNLVIQANEVVELNGSKIYYTSVDHRGDFRVGDLFYVSQADGTVEFTTSLLSIVSTSGLTIIDGPNQTVIDSSKVQTGNIRISGNTIESLVGNLNLLSATNEINLQNNVNVTGDLDVTGNVTIGGNITVGDNTSDTVSFVAEVTSNVIPKTDSTYDLGTDSQRWNTLFVEKAVTGDIEITNNVVKTVNSNSDLELRANGTGVVSAPLNDVTIPNTLTVNGTTTLSNTDITGLLTHVGNTNQIGNVTQTGNLTQVGSINVSSIAQFENIQINNNVITTTESNANLELRAHGTGSISVPSNDLEITQNLTVLGTTSTANFNSSGTITAAGFDAGDISINNNVITTTISNSNLELRANGTGTVYVPNNNVQIDNDLTVNGTTNVLNTTITGTLTHTGNTIQTGNLTQNGSFTLSGGLTVGGLLQLDNINIDNNLIKTTDSNSSLEIRAAGTGKVVFPDNDVQIAQNLTVLGTTSTVNFNSTGTITAQSFASDDILIDNNVITTVTSNSNLELRANGTGNVYFPNNDVQIDQDITVNGVTNLNSTVNITGDVTQTGNISQTGNVNQTGSYTLSANLTVGGVIQLDDLRFSGNVIQTTDSNSNLELRANGTGTIYVPSNNVQIDNNLTVNGTTITTNFVSTGTLTANQFSTSDILFDDNYITTTVSNSNLELRAHGTGTVYVPSNNVQIDNNLTVNGTTDLSNTNITGNISHSGNVTQVGNINQTGAYNLTGDLTVGGLSQFENIKIDTNVITTTLSASDLELRAHSTGKIYVPNNNVQIDNNLTVNGTSTFLEVVVSGRSTSDEFSTGDILIKDNFITTTVSNSNLELRTNGTGFIVVEDFNINQNTITSNNNTNIVIEPTGTGIVNINSTQSIKIPVGTTAERPTAQAGMIRFNTSINHYEGYDGTNWIVLDGVYDLDRNTYITTELTPGANDNTIRFYANGVLVADLNTTRLTANEVTVDSININNNVISTLSGNSNIVFSPNGTGATRLGNFAIKGNEITNVVADAITLFSSTGTGYFKVNGTNGFVIPVGDSGSRPVYAVEGMTRYNNQAQQLEIFDGLTWKSAAGEVSGINEATANDIAAVSALIFG